MAEGDGAEHERAREIVRTFIEGHHDLQTLADVEQVCQAFGQVIARRGATAINAAINACAGSKVEEVREHIAAVSRALDRMNLGIVCPVTGRAGRLVGTTARHDPNKSRIAIVVQREDGGRIKTVTKESLPTLIVVPKCSSIEEWVALGGQQKSMDADDGDETGGPSHGHRAKLTSRAADLER